MAGIKISALTAAGSSLLTDIFPAVQGGVTYKETLQQVMTLFQASMTNLTGLTGLVTFPTAITGASPTMAVRTKTTAADTVTLQAYDTLNAVYSTFGTLTANNPPTFAISGASSWTGGAIGAAYGGTGTASPTTKTLPVANGSNAFTFLGPLTNGQLLIGNTGNNPTAAAITAGLNITITNSAGGITIAAAGPGGFSWNNVTGTTQTMVSNNGYIANNAGLVTMTLPAASAIGDELAILGAGAGGWIVAQGAGQTIHVGSVASTAGVGGSVASTNQFDSMYMICIIANTTWVLEGAPQSSGLTIV